MSVSFDAQSAIGMVELSSESTNLDTQWMEDLYNKNKHLPATSGDSATSAGVSVYQTEMLRTWPKDELDSESECSDTSSRADGGALEVESGQRKKRRTDECERTSIAHVYSHNSYW